MENTLTPTESEYLVTGKQQVLKLCRRIVASKKPVAINFNQNRESFTSLLFDVNTRRNSFFLDSLHPDRGSELLIAGQSASIKCKLDGVTTWFGAGKVIDQGSSNGYPWLEMVLPKRAWHQQRRSAFRAQAISAMDLSVKLYSLDHTNLIDANIVDLSTGGCRVIVDEQTAQQIQPDEAFYRCQLSQSAQPIINCGAVVRHLEPAGPDRHSQMGLSFIDLTPQLDSALSQLVMKLEMGLNRVQLLA